jgi:hypothetical protein
MQQLILLLTSFLLGCGFPAFLIGLDSTRIWESRLRSLSLSFVGSGSSTVRNLDQNTRRIARTEIGIFVERRGINQVDLLPL